VAGLLIQTLGAANAVVVDSLSYVVSAAAVWRIRKPEETRPHSDRPTVARIWAEFLDGVSMLARHGLLWRLTACTALANLGADAALAVYLIYLYRVLHLPPVTVGVAFAAGGIGSMVGAFGAGRASQSFGVGRVIALSIACSSLGWFLLPLGQFAAAPAVAVVAALVAYVPLSIFNVTQVSLRQAVVPSSYLGRVNATYRMIVLGVATPVGYLVGGVLGSTLGLVPALLIGGSINLLSCVLVLDPAVFKVRRVDEVRQPQPAR
jgi:MFS family permease